MSRNINFPDKIVAKTYTTPAAAPYSSYPVVLSQADGVAGGAPWNFVSALGAFAANHVGSKMIIHTGLNKGVYTVTARNSATQLTIVPAPVAEATITYFVGGLNLPLTLGTDGCLGLKKINGIQAVGLVVGGVGYAATRYASDKGTVIMELWNQTTGAQAATTTNVGGMAMHVQAVGL